MILFVLMGLACAANTWTVGPTGQYTTIQAAIDAGTTLAGDTIQVTGKSTAYAESVIVTKSLILEGLDDEDGLPIIDPTGNVDAITLRASGCTIRGFVVQGANYGGIYVEPTSSDNIIENNIIRNNAWQGVFLDTGSSNNVVMNNEIYDNTLAGIEPYGSTDNIIYRNTVYNNDNGIYVHKAGNNNNISDNDIHDNRVFGINFGFQSDAGSSGNVVKNNTVRGNVGGGISFDAYCSGNYVYLNTFNNTNNAQSSSANKWNATTTQTYVYNGETISGYLGNVWSDYAGPDNNGDGIGDWPYNINSVGVDYNPIVGKSGGPSIEVKKIADREAAVIGELINYTIWVNNTGTVALTGVRAEDNLTSAIWEVGTLQPGGSYTNTTSHVVTEADLPGPITNELWANGTDPDSTEANDSAIETVDVLYNAEIKVNKTVNKSGGLSGIDLAFTINVTNIGDVSLNDVEVADFLPDGLAYISSTPAGAIDGKNVTWDLGNFNPGSSTLIEMTVEIESGTPSGILSNRVNATGTLSIIGANISNETTCNVGVGIQAAIDAAQDGDTIVVPSGTYDEHVNVTKQLTLRGIGSPVVDAGGSGSAITISADGCTLEGFVAQNAGDSGFDSGIIVYSNNNTISDNTVTDNYCGIYIYFSSSNTISENTATDNYYGIYLKGDSNTISGNIATDNFDGINIGYSNSNTISGNTITGNGNYGICTNGVSNTISENTVTGNGNYGIYLGDKSDDNIIYLNTFDNDNNAGDFPRGSYWNATTNVTWEHEGRNLTGFLGNVWSDYDGFDCDGDGIGDTPYNLSGGRDYNPIGGLLCGPGIEVEKVADVSSAEIGEVINYTIRVNNTGNVTLTSVWAEDNLTSDVWDVGTLAPGENYTNTTWYRVNETDLPGPITNELWANGTDPCGFDVNDSAIKTVSVLYDPKIEVDKTTNLSSGAPSTTIEFTINVTNTGNVNFSIVNLTDYLPGGLEYDSDDQPTRTIDGDNVTWNLGPLNRTDSKMVKLVAHIDGTVFGTLENRAEAVGTAPLGDEVADDAEAEIEALKAEIDVEKTCEVDYNQTPTNATFTIKVKNAGEIKLTKVVAVDTLPAGLTYSSSSPAGTKVGDTITWPNLGPLAEAETAEITIFTTVDGAATEPLTNEVNVTGTPEHGENVTDQDNATVTAALDFGDAPDPSYSTLLANGGARHVIVPGFMLGSQIDGEYDGQPTATADGDDVAGVDDEDGVTFATFTSDQGEVPFIVVGGFANVVVEATASGKLDAWIDFDYDGSWTASDQIFTSEPIESGTNYLQFNVSETATPDVMTFARFRFSTEGGLSPAGLADDGEVEDYAVKVLKDSDGDGVPDKLEPEGDRDGDGIPNYLDYDPSGYFYNESDGQIISGGKIGVTGPGVITIVKDGSDGYYEFWTDGTPGLYEMKLTFPSGYILSPTCSPGGSFDPTGKPDPVYLGSDEYGSTGYLASGLCADNPYYLSFNLEPGDPFVMTNNIPLAQLNSIGDLVWNDLDGDGCQDDDEPGIQGVSVTLLYENGTEANGTTTGPGGLYIFSDVLPGEYRVKFDPPEGGSFSPAHQCDESMDSDADPVTGLSDLVVLETNENDMTIDAGLHTSLNVTKTVDKKSASRGEELTYTIRICNPGNLTATNVVVEDVFDKNVEFVYADPAPDADGLWRFAEIPARKCVTITLVVRVPKQDFVFDMAQDVSGRGYVNVANDYSTTLQPYTINNRVKVSWGAVEVTDSASVSVLADPGTELETREHGSGSYDSDELVAVRTENKSISMDKDVAATYAPTTLGLYNNRTVSYSSKWTAVANAKNRVTGASLSEQYRYATSIYRDSRIFLDENESVMEVESEFEGMGHIGFLKMPSNSSTPQTTPLFESSEDYTGSFKVLEKADEYGSSVSSEKAASGSGLVVVDKRVGDSQRSHESGSGSYDSEELIETATNYIAKDISLEYVPTSSKLTDDVSINSSLKWTEGMYSKNPGSSYIGEEYTSITELDKETAARGLNEMDTAANFSGQAWYRTVLERNGTEPEVDFDESYNGDYSVERRVIFTGVAKYDRPHLNVTKTLDGIVEETLSWGYGEEHLAGATKTREVASYTISIENDGNKALGPVYVQDLFPPGSAYIEASIRPMELTETNANWTLLNIGIGDVVAIDLELDVSEYHPSELVNRVKVWGGINNGDDWVYASNFSALEVSWLTCCPEGPLTVETMAETNGTVVRYEIDISNQEDATRVATVTDHLPAGMELVESSIPFASYEDGVVVWNLVEIPASGTAEIEFSALAPGSGRFTNSVEVDPRSVDGSVVQPVSATCVIDVGTVSDECGTVSCDSWQPPDWEFEHYGYGSDGTTCEDLTCTSCGGTDSWLAQ